MNAPVGSRLQNDPSRRRLATATALHATFWLVVGNSVGVLLASLLLMPRLGSWLGPLTYGRLMPVHLDLQFYGWIALPLLGALLLFLEDGGPATEAGGAHLGTLALAGWSAALAFGVVWLLAGHSSGKVFLEWHGLARLALALAGCGLAFAGVATVWRRLRAARRGDQLARRGRWARLVLVLLVAPIPFAMVASTSRSVYPPINPDSGGATNGRTAASVLGVVGVMLAGPVLLGLPTADGGRRRRRAVVGWLAHVALMGVLVVWLGGGDRSHHEPLQVAALLSTIPWLPTLVWTSKVEAWSPVARRWLAAAAFWGVVTLATGIVAGWPGLAEAWKFTNGLVGHVHAAVAGLTTSWLVAFLAAAVDSASFGASLRGLGLWGWQLGLLAQVAALLILGTLEGQRLGLVFLSIDNPVVTTAFAFRLAGGVAMFATSIWWLRAAWRTWSKLEVAT